MTDLKVLIVGGTFNEKPNNGSDAGYAAIWRENQNNTESTGYGRASGLVSKVFASVKKFASFVTCINGGRYTDLKTILKNEAGKYDIVFWWPDVDDNLPKLRNVKEKHPKVMLVTAERNIDNKYSSDELNQRAKMSKSDLVFEFSDIPPIVIPKLNGKPYYKIRVLDPSGYVWADTTDIDDAVGNSLTVFTCLKSITR